MQKLNHLWSKIDEYHLQTMSKETNTDSKADLEASKATFRYNPLLALRTEQSPRLGSEYRSMKSSKKRYIHTKKRAIAKASKRKKYDLVLGEKKSAHHKSGPCCKTSSDAPQSLLLADEPLNGPLKKSIGSECNSAESDTKHADNNSLEKTSSVTLDASTEEESVTSDAATEASCGENDGANCSLASLASLVIDEELETGFPSHEGATEEEDKSRDRKNANKPSEIFGSKDTSKGNSLLLSKLYQENIELAETLASTQSELEQVNRRLNLVTIEQNKIAEAACFEM